VHDAINLKRWKKERDLVHKIVMGHLESVLDDDKGSVVEILADPKVSKCWEGEEIK
jgi:hypothetical protein